MWRKYYQSVLVSFLAVLTFSACSPEQWLEDPMVGNDNLTLSFSCFQPHTRALEYQENGKRIWNENKIVRLDCFFYRKSDGNDVPAVHRLSFVSLLGEETITVQANLGNEIIEKLYGDTESTCRIYVIANLPDNNVIGADKSSVNELKKMKVAASFAVNAPQSSFVMDSDGTDQVVYDRKKKELAGSVSLNRTAAKISLTVTDIREVTDANGATWKPDVNGMSIMLYNGISKSFIDSDLFPNVVTDADRFDFSKENAIPLESVTKVMGGAESKVYEQKLPFYSYASDWSNEGREVYLLLIVPWQKNGQGAYQPCFYQIPVNSERKNLKRNQYYKINLSVSTLGTFDPVKPAMLRPSYVIMEWSSHDINADLQNYKYLMVSPTNYVMHNRNILEVSYASSHPVEIVSQKCTQINLSQNTVVQKDVQQSAYKLQINQTNHTITYQKELDNDYRSQSFDLTPYKLTFTVQHVGDPSFKEEIEIIQYPAIYAEYERNSDYGNSSSNNQNHGYVFVNGYYSSGSSSHSGLNNQDFFGSAAGIHGFESGRYSPNRYVFTVTSVQGTDYIIGDPRVKEPSIELRNAKRKYRNPNTGVTAWVKAPAMDGGSSRGLENYYPTDGSDATRKMIAPRFRIASTYGGFYHKQAEASKSLDGMVKRCASYQEDGYPAGRWRLPTEAEFKFMITLVNKGKLPPIYVLDSPYWCAHGLGQYDSKSGKVNILTQSSSQSVRCVYDEWYWNDKLPDNKKKQFTWGDKPR